MSPAYLDVPPGIDSAPEELLGLQLLIWITTLSNALAADGGHGGGHGHAAADAAHGAAEHGGSASAGAVVLLAMVGGAYLLTRFVVNRLQRRFLFVSGMEYIVLGVLLGPAFVNTVAVFDDISRLAPVIAFAAGWIALMYGMELRVRALMDEIPERSVRLAFAEVLGTGLATGGAAYGFFVSGIVIDPLPMTESACAACVMACAAAAGSSSAVDLLATKYQGLESRLLHLLRHVSRFGDIIAILGLGVVFALFHQPSGEEATFQPQFAGWLLTTIALGTLLGGLFSVFLDDDADENHRFLALTGIIVLAAGMSFFLEISALAVNLILGAILVNSPDGKKVAATLESSVQPVTLVLMVFAGLMWAPVDPFAGLVVTVGYILVRGVSKALSLFLAAVGTPLRRDLFRGLMAQGEAAVAIAISFRLVFDGEAAELAYTAILVSVMLNELVAPRLLKGLLIDTGELDSDATSWTRSA